MNEQLKKLLEYLLEEELEEQNALGGGGVAATSTGLGLNVNNFRPAGSRRKRLKEINTVWNSTGFTFGDISRADDGNMDAAQQDADMNDNDKKSPNKDRGRDREDNKRRKKKKTFEFRKSKQGYNSTADTMWNYGDKPLYRDGKAGILPANKVKYIALEEQSIPNSKKADRVRIFQDKGHPMKQDSLNVLIDFLKFCNSILKLEDFPDIYLHTIKKPDMTTGMYNRSEHMIHVLVGKRLLVDVLRTIAHELTHARQHETGLLDIHLANVDPMNEMGDIDTVYENEAYTLAGNIVKIFCRKYKKVSKDDLYQLNENKRWL